MKKKNIYFRPQAGSIESSALIVKTLTRNRIPGETVPYRFVGFSICRIFKNALHLCRGLLTKIVGEMQMMPFAYNETKCM